MIQFLHKRSCSFRNKICSYIRDVRRDSVVGVATLYVQTGPGGHPASCAMSAGLLSQGKVAGAWRWTPTPSSAEVKKRVELSLYSPTGPSWPVLGRTLPFSLFNLWPYTSNWTQNKMGRDNEMERMDVYSTAILNWLKSGKGKGEGGTC